MRNRLKQMAKKDKYILLYYAIIAVIIGVCYLPAKSVMIRQTAWIETVKSNVTLNFVLFFFLFGVVCTKLTRNMPRRRAWLIWGIGLLTLIVLFRSAGMDTIFG